MSAPVAARRCMLTASSLVLRRHLEVAAWRHLSASSRLNGGHGHDAHGHGHGHHPPSHGGEYRYEPIKCEIGKREVKILDLARRSFRFPCTCSDFEVLSH